MKKRESTVNKAGDSEGEAQCGCCHGRLGGQAGRPAGVLLSVRCRKPRSRKRGRTSLGGRTHTARVLFNQACVFCGNLKLKHLLTHTLRTFLLPLF